MYTLHLAEEEMKEKVEDLNLSLCSAVLSMGTKLRAVCSDPKVAPGGTWVCVLLSPHAGGE